jgi:hypothetical protein
MDDQPSAAHHSGVGQMTSTTARIATVHGEASLAIRLALLDAIEAVMHDFGVEHVWIDPDSRTDLLVLARDVPR